MTMHGTDGSQRSGQQEDNDQLLGQSQKNLSAKKSVFLAMPIFLP
jgi:hypothetical protein